MRNSRVLLVLIVLCALALVAAPAVAAKKKKKKKRGQVEPPPAGRVTVGQWTCYGAPDFAKMTNSERRSARADALEYLTTLVNGQLQEGFAMEGESLLLFETAFLGRPQLLDGWLGENFAQCKSVAEGKLDPKDYAKWLGAAAREFEAGECYKPLTYEYHNFLDIQSEWQMRLHICKDDKILIESTGEENGQYTIEDTGKAKKNTYITASGDPAQPEAGDKGIAMDLPAGALIMRFEAEDESMTKFFLVGHRLEFHADQHGFISFTINDTTYFDNKFRNVGGAIDYLGVDIYPPEDQEGNYDTGVVP